MALRNYIREVEGLSKFLSITANRIMGIAVFTFAELGIADLMVSAPTEGITAEKISAKENLQSDLVYRLLRCCADAGIVEKLGSNNDHFILTPSGRLLASDDPSGARDFIRFMHGRMCEEPLAALPDLIRQTTSVEEVQKRIYGGLDMYEWLTQPEQAELLAVENGCNRALSTLTGNELLAAIDFSCFSSIVDCGGNEGTLLAQILERHNQIEHGIIFDLPSMIKAVTNTSFELRHIDPSRYEFMSGDLLDTSTIPPDADAYIIKNTLDAFDDDQIVAVLSNIRQAVYNRGANQKPRTVFLIGAIILPDDCPAASNVNWVTHGVDLIDNALLGTKERTVDQFKQLLKKAGLEFIKLHLLNHPTSAIESLIAQTLSK